MSVAEEMQEAQNSYGKPGPLCSVCVWLSDRPDREEWETAIKVFGKKAAHIVLVRHGYHGSISAVQRHQGHA